MDRTGLVSDSSWHFVHTASRLSATSAVPASLAMAPANAFTTTRIPAAAMNFKNFMTCLPLEFGCPPGPLARGCEEPQLTSERKNPVDKILDLGRVLAGDDLVFLFVAVRELDLLARRDVVDQLGFGLGLALVLGRHFAPRHRFLFLVHCMALETIALARQCARRFLVGALCPAGGAQGQAGNERRGRHGKQNFPSVHAVSPMYANACNADMRCRVRLGRYRVFNGWALGAGTAWLRLIVINPSLYPPFTHAQSVRLV